MSNKRPDRPKFTSPRGTFVWPELVKPGYGTDKFPKPDGIYKVTLRLDDEGNAKLQAMLAKTLEQAKAEAEEAFAALPVANRKKLGEIKLADVGNPEYDRDTEEPTGNTLVRFTMKASGDRKRNGQPTGERWERKPFLFDARGTPIKNPPAIWSGTEGCISFEAVPYFVAGTGVYGLSLRLQAAQIIVLRSGGGSADAGAYGFGAADDEDGYEAGAYVATEGDTADTDGDATDGADF